MLTDLLRTIPGVQVFPGKHADEEVFMRGGQAILGPGLCRPDLRVMVRQSRTTTTFPINSLVAMDEIRAVEVYTHSSLVPDGVSVAERSAAPSSSGLR